MQTSASVTISGQLIGHVESLFHQGLSYLTSGKVLVLKETRNGFSDLALPAYIVAVAAVEAFANEAYLSPLPRMVLKESSLYDFRDEWLARLEVQDKLVLVARLLLGASLRRDRQPFQDFIELVRVRNEVVHYKMDGKVPAFVRDLNQKKVGLDTKPPEGTDKSQVCQPWAWEVSTTEGIRWAHNTAINMMRHMCDIAPQNADEYEKRGLEGTVDYKAFSHLLEMQQFRISRMKTIDDRIRDAAWEALGLSR